MTYIIGLVVAIVVLVSGLIAFVRGAGMPAKPSKVDRARKGGM